MTKMYMTSFLKKGILPAIGFLSLFIFICSIIPVFAEVDSIEQAVSGRRIRFENSISVYNVKKEKSDNTDKKDIPKGITIDQEGRLFVIFLHRKKIQVFNQRGSFIYEFGTKGIGKGEFLSPIDIEASADGRILVLDSSSKKIIIFDNKGRFINEFSIENGIEKGEKPVSATKMGLDRRNNIVYVADTQNSVVRRFTIEGQYLGKIGHSGSGEGDFTLTGAITVDREGNVYVTDLTMARVQVYEPDLSFKHSLGSYGSKLGNFIRPNAIVTDSKNRIYVLDRMLSVIQVFDNKGNVLGVIKDLEGKNLLKKAAPFDLAIDDYDRIYISCQDYFSVKVIKDLE